MAPETIAVLAGAAVGGPGMVAFTVTAILTGRLIPVRTHDREMAMKDKTIETLEKTVRLQEQLDAERRAQLAALLSRTPPER